MDDKKVSNEKKFVKVVVKDKSESLLQCGGGHLCNEPK